MKKAVILFLAVLVLFVGTVSVLGASVHSACDQVVYTESRSMAIRGRLAV